MELSEEQTPMVARRSQRLSSSHYRSPPNTASLLLASGTVSGWSAAAAQGGWGC